MHYIHTYIHPYIAYIHTYIHTYTYTRIHIYNHIHVYTYTHTWFVLDFRSHHISIMVGFRAGNRQLSHGGIPWLLCGTPQVIPTPQWYIHNQLNNWFYTRNMDFTSTATSSTYVTSFYLPISIVFSLYMPLVTFQRNHGVRPLPSQPLPAVPGSLHQTCRRSRQVSRPREFFRQPWLICVQNWEVLEIWFDLMMAYKWLYIYIHVYTSSTAQGGGGSFKNRTPIGEVGCCESGMAERSHWWTERCLRSPLSLFLSFSLCFSILLWLSTYQPTDLSVYLSICLSIYLPIYLSSTYLSSCLVF